MGDDLSPGLRLLGEEWIDHGYPLTPVLPEDLGPCPICGAPNTTCTGREFHNGIEPESPAEESVFADDFTGIHRSLAAEQRDDADSGDA